MQWISQIHLWYNTFCSHDDQYCRAHTLVRLELKEVSRCSTRGESEEFTTDRPRSTAVRRSILVLKLRADLIFFSCFPNTVNVVNREPSLFTAHPLFLAQLPNFTSRFMRRVVPSGSNFHAVLRKNLAK